MSYVYTTCTIDELLALRKENAELKEKVATLLYINTIPYVRCQACDSDWNIEQPSFQTCVIGKIKIYNQIGLDFNCPACGNNVESPIFNRSENERK